MISSPASITDPCAWLLALSTDCPQHPCLSTTDRLWTYRDAFDTAGRMAAALAGLGTRAGDRVAVQVEKSPEAFLLYLGCLRLGAVFVPLNTAYTPNELDYFITDAEPTVVVVRPADLARIEELAAVREAKARGARIRTLGDRADGSLMDRVSSVAPDDFPAFTGDADALAALLYTSGTTGRSKGAMITRGNLASNAVTLVDAWRVTAGDVMLHALPIFHTHGLFIAGNTILAAGAHMRFLPHFDAADVLRHLPQCTLMMGVPTFYTRLLQQPGLNRESTAHVRLFVSGSAPLLAETHREFRERTGHAILERYAMTETVVNTSNPYVGDRVPGAVGFPLPGVSLRIADLATAEILTSPDAVGVIEVKGPNLFKGYWRNPEKTAIEMRADGFFITGDIGRVDSRGYVYIVGRAKDLIITGGYNVYPKEVEAEIDEIEGVLESAVIGLAHSDLGEGVTAIVTLRAGAQLDEQTVQRLLAGRLAKYKLPKRVLFVDELPRNALGKVQKNLLRNSFQGLYA